MIWNVISGIDCSNIVKKLNTVIYFNWSWIQHFVGLIHPRTSLFFAKFNILSNLFLLADYNYSELILRGIFYKTGHFWKTLTSVKYIFLSIKRGISQKI